MGTEMVHADVQDSGAVNEAFGQWQPIETAPKDGTEISVRLSNGDVTMAFYAADPQPWKQPRMEGWMIDMTPSFAAGNAFDAQPTHWMSLPPAPENDDRTNTSTPATEE